MVWILWPLAILSLVAGALNFPELLSGSEWLARDLAVVPGSVFPVKPTPGVEVTIISISGLISILGLLCSYFLYRPRAIGSASPLGEWFEQLFFSGFYLDRLYHFALVGPYQTISRFLWEKVDEDIVDAGLEGASKTLPAISIYFQLWTTGRLSTYLKMLFLGFTAILGAIALGWYSW
jgi:NADH:ubiquinone oxidoreductase subunit 5 (subunit L)/multisubunit Na+/H+ antiporter MnhA subunit